MRSSGLPSSPPRSVSALRRDAFLQEPEAFVVEPQRLERRSSTASRTSSSAPRGYSSEPRARFSPDLHRRDAESAAAAVWLGAMAFSGTVCPSRSCKRRIDPNCYRTGHRAPKHVSRAREVGDAGDLRRRQGCVRADPQIPAGPAATDRGGTVRTCEDCPSVVRSTWLRLGPRESSVGSPDAFLNGRMAMEIAGPAGGRLGGGGFNRSRNVQAPPRERPAGGRRAMPHPQSGRAGAARLAGRPGAIAGVPPGATVNVGDELGRRSGNDRRDSAEDTA